MKKKLLALVLAAGMLLASVGVSSAAVSDSPVRNTVECEVSSRTIVVAIVVIVIDNGSSTTVEIDTTVVVYE